MSESLPLSAGVSRSRALARLLGYSLIGLLLNVLTDIAYHMVDPRIDFESRGRG